MADPIATVMTWHDALNAGDVERIVALADVDVEMGGPRGAVRGASVLRQWAEQSGIQLQPQRVFHRDERVVVGQLASWRAADTREMTEAEPVASAFIVHDDRIMSVIRYPDLVAALEASGHSTDDEVTPP